MAADTSSLRRSTYLCKKLLATQSERTPTIFSRSTSKVIANLHSFHIDATLYPCVFLWIYLPGRNLVYVCQLLTEQFVLVDATRVIVADTLTYMLQTCERLEKYKKEFSEMLLEQDGVLGRTAQQNQEEKQVRLNGYRVILLASCSTPLLVNLPTCLFACYHRFGF